MVPHCRSCRRLGVCRANLGERQRSAPPLARSVRLAFATRLCNR
ncbi:hypothetical protein Pd630_LPD06511 [Rhodococcus opacus PD630]|nr:hypothetical protein Pd630_LPD06511 [Rhodococcus opacus PD630]